MKVVLIDDEEIIREGLKAVIDWNSLDCKIVGEAEDGDEGISLVKELNPDIIFTDIRMPGLDGLQMIKQIKEINNDAKIIILTGFRDFEYAQEAVRLGAFRFILKPSKTDEITQAVIDAIKDLKIVISNKEMINNMKNKVKEFYGLESTTNNISSNDLNNSNFLVNKAVSYMKDNYINDLNLKIIADELYISTWYLSKIIKKETGSTFIDLLNEIRISEAKKLLYNQKYKVYEISSLCGFKDVAYFTKVFKKITGVTPLEYRNNIC